VPCDVCRGQRYNRETLEITYRGKNIHEVLQMTVEEALRFFQNIPAVAGKLQTLVDVGLSYLHLGQNATTLSGGEAQRVKLARELAKRATGRTLYVLDEPTTGLHFHDVAQLLEVLLRLRDSGNTILVIEHNLDVIKSADWVIDLGPEGAQGRPRRRQRHARARCRVRGVLYRTVPAALLGLPSSRLSRPRYDKPRRISQALPLALQMRTVLNHTLGMDAFAAPGGLTLAPDPSA